MKNGDDSRKSNGMIFVRKCVIQVNIQTNDLSWERADPSSDQNAIGILERRAREIELLDFKQYQMESNSMIFKAAQLSTLSTHS